MCDDYVAETGKDAIARLSMLLKEWYIMRGIEWTPIMPDTKYVLIFEDNRLRDKTDKALKARRYKQPPTLLPDVADSDVPANSAVPVSESAKVVEPPPSVDRESDETGRAIMPKLSERVGEQRFDLWFGQDTSCKVEGECTTFYVRNNFAVKSIRRHCHQEIADVLDSFGLQYRNCTFVVGS